MVRLWLVLLAVVALDAPAFAQDEQYAPGVWKYRSVACVDTTVRSVQPRLMSDDQKTYTPADFQQSGVFVEFNTTLGSDPVNRNMRAAVTHYQGTPGNAIMIREHRGDKVQVCFLSRPAPTLYCDPDTDGRGRMFRVYDYRQHAQYSGMNSEHDCGGA
ncbi:MAG TPA: hypothetical protein VGX91_10605 [Candidatus Cybelea sp.]|jgi:hypothetical protein|nr:hypothetical protein [Candidatus Cybelea sp.]